MISWYLEGAKLGNCNCDYSCPCQFEALPTQGDCCGIEVIEIERGYFGAVRLDRLRAAMVYQWPGPIFKGGGAMQAIVDERADPDQRAALIAILHGQETVEAATHWWVFHAMSSVVHPTLFRPITFEIDIAARTAAAQIPGVLSAAGRPIRNPVNGADHRVRIDLPGGIEFEMAEIGSASAQVTAAQNMQLNDSYGQFNRFRLSSTGIVRGRA